MMHFSVWSWRAERDCFSEVSVLLWYLQVFGVREFQDASSRLLKWSLEGVHGELLL